MAEKTYEKRDYVEWDGKTAAPKKQADDRFRVENIFDTEVRRRIGELIARASEGAEKTKK